MRTELGSPVARRRGKLEHRVSVVRSRRMAREAAEVSAVVSPENGESLRVEVRPQIAGQAFLDSALSELVPETDAEGVGLQDSSCDALVERRAVHTCQLEQLVSFGARPEHRCGSYDGLSFVGQPRHSRENRVPHRRKNTASSAGEDFGDVERVSGGRAMKG